MSPEQFRELGYRMVDRVASYMASVGDRPIRDPSLKPGDIASALPDAPPHEPGGSGAWDAIFGDLDAIIDPGLMHWQHPGFYGYFPCNTTGPAILGELLSAGLGVQGMLWSTSPAVTELETRMLDWMASAIGLPDRFCSTSHNGGGSIQGTASEAAVVALVAARRRVSPGADIREPVVYTSAQAHSSITKAAMLTGIARGAEDRERVRLIETDHLHRMKTAALERALDEDLAAGRTPVALCPTLGTTSSGAFDPLTELARLWRAKVGAKPWIHVDAAWAGAAMVCPELREFTPEIDEGLALVDSFCFNPHKWLLTTFDCDLFWVADRRGLTESLSITPEYLRNAATDSGEVWDYRDWQAPLGRRFRALKLWFVFRHYGIEGMRAHIRGHVESTAELERAVGGSEHLELATERSLSLLCVRHRAGNDATRRLHEALNANGDLFLSHTILPAAEDGGEHEDGGRFVIRVAVGTIATTPAHVRALGERLIELAAAVES